MDAQWQKAASNDLTANKKQEHALLLADLKSCRNIRWGIAIHARALASQSGSNIYVVTALIRMYAKCGSMVQAAREFDRIRKPDVVSWNVLLLGFVENGNGVVALELFSRMKACGCAPNSVTYIAVLKACSSLAMNGYKGDCLERGRKIHLEIGCHLDVYVQNTLVDMYSKCGSMVEARCVFDRLQKPDVVSWNALLLGYAENGAGLVTLSLFLKMKSQGCMPSAVTYVAALKACACLAANADNSAKRGYLNRGREIHMQIGCHLDHYMLNMLIDMYSKCNSMVDARCMFDRIQKPNVVSWTSLLLGYAENGEGFVCLDLFSRMKLCGCKPNSVTYVAALKACISLAINERGKGKEDFLERGRKIHSEIGLHLDYYLQSTLVDMYAKCGSMVDARTVFDNIEKPDVVCWTALLLGYAENGEGEMSVYMFSRMKACGCVPNSVTYVAVLKACGWIGALSLGQKFHSEVTEFTPLLVTCLVYFYAKCASMVEAHEVFDLHSRARGVSTWNALLTGYSTFGDSESVFKLFEAMLDEGFQPDAITFVCMLFCCSHAGLVQKARDYFEVMQMYGIARDVTHYNCMVDMLGRANQLNEAIVVIREMPCNPNAVTWRALLGACYKWKNAGIGRIAFLSLVGLDSKDASAHMLMSHVYTGLGLWHKQVRVMEPA